MKRCALLLTLLLTGCTGGGLFVQYNELMAEMSQFDGSSAEEIIYNTTKGAFVGKVVVEGLVVKDCQVEIKKADLSATLPMWSQGTIILKQTKRRIPDCVPD